MNDLINSFAAYQRQKNPDTALELIRKLRASRQVEDAIELAIKWSPKMDSLVHRTQLGIDMNYLGMFQQALPLLQETLPQWEEYPREYYLAASELSMVRYSLGQFHEGHSLFRSLREPQWCEVWSRLTSFNGDNSWLTPYRDKVLGNQSVAGKRIMIGLEGGVGDILLFARYVESLHKDGASAIYCQAPHYLHGLLKNSSLPITPIDHQVDDCDYLTWNFSLNAIYQESPYFPSATEGYVELATDYVLPDVIRQKLIGRDLGRRRVGLVWRSATTVRHEPFRSIDLNTLVPLLEADSAKFFSLQVGEHSPDEEAILKRHGVVDLGMHLSSFEDTAHILNHLDLLITIDSAPAHLAGACNRPVWVMLAQACDHRWYDCQRYTPWYKSMRLYRQTTLGNWQQVIDDMVASLRA